MAISVESDAAHLAFDRLYRLYSKDVYRYALSIMRDPAEAEDVTQTTFLNAWRAYRAGLEPQRPQHWLIAIAQNACRLRFRTRSRRPGEVPLEEGAHAAAPAPDGPRARDLLDALGDLPLNQRAALVMRELEGRSYDEIARLLGVSGAAVETLIFRARQTMRKRHGSLRGLALLPLPSWLKPFVRDRGLEGGSAAAGAGIAVHAAAAVVAATAIAVGVGTSAAPAESRTGPSSPAAAPVVAAAVPTAPTPDRIVASGTPLPTRAGPEPVRTAPAAPAPAVGGQAAEPRQEPRAAAPVSGGGTATTAPAPVEAARAAPGAAPPAEPAIAIVVEAVAEVVAAAAPKAAPVELPAALEPPSLPPAPALEPPSLPLPPVEVVVPALPPAPVPEPLPLP